jgi:hypothetical protein
MSQSLIILNIIFLYVIILNSLIIIAYLFYSILFYNVIFSHKPILIFSQQFFTSIFIYLDYFYHITTYFHSFLILHFLPLNYYRHFLEAYKNHISFFHHSYHLNLYFFNINPSIIYLDYLGSIKIATFFLFEVTLKIIFAA